MRNQLFHLPDAEGRFGPCDIKRVCTEDTHGADCAQKCHQDHQQIMVKGHGGRQYVLVDDHGSHTVIEDDLTPDDFDPTAHLREVVATSTGVDSCHDCKFETWTPAEWAKENARLGREGKSLADRVRPVTDSVG
jgi:hypothetical protein